MIISVSVRPYQLMKDLFCPEVRGRIWIRPIQTMRNSVLLLISVLLNREDGLVGLQSSLQGRWVQYLIAIASLSQHIGLREILLRHVGRRFLICDINLCQIGKGLRERHGIVGAAHRRVGTHFYREGLFCNDALEILPFIRHITFQLRERVYRRSKFRGQASEFSATMLK